MQKSPTGQELLGATAEILFRASILMNGSAVFADGRVPSAEEEAAWREAIGQIDASEEACRRGLVIGGADYLDAFIADLFELLDARAPGALVPPGARRMLYAALAMTPAISASMRESAPNHHTPERTPT